MRPQVNGVATASHERSCDGVSGASRSNADRLAEPSGRGTRELPPSDGTAPSVRAEGPMAGLENGGQGGTRNL